MWPLALIDVTPGPERMRSVNENGDESGLRVDILSTRLQRCSTAGRSSTNLVAVLVDRNRGKNGGEAVETAKPIE